MSFLSYIPTAEEVNRCIKNEAEGAHEAILLAVHQPTPLSYKSSYGISSGSQSVSTDEQSLFNYLVDPHVPSGALVVPITGASGAGKSHLVRILNARLKSSPETKNHLIIRIPKSASLRRVVELILDPLPENTYSKVKKAFQKALASVDVETSAIRFSSELEIALKTRALELETEIRENLTQSLRIQLDHAKRLPLLLNDSETGKHFRQTVFPRILRRAIAGVNDKEVDATEGQFSAKDLHLPDSIDLGQAAKSVSSYYQTALQSREGIGKEIAASVLNSVVNQATKQLFNLNEAVEGMTLEEVILEIRKLLLKEKKDLFLLVEDFAALTGIQDTLAKVLIQEGIRDGVHQYATMRSVIAVTDGYLVGKDTLATRAMREWIVESKIDSEEEVIRRTRLLVASYLNASRWGEKELIKRYESRSSSSRQVSDWLPVYDIHADEKVSKMVSAFGNENDIALFPFNPDAVEYLTRASLTGPDGLVFNPRFIINEVIRKVLLSAHSSFEKNRFPSANIFKVNSSADVSQWKSTLNVTPDLKERYELTAVIWGNNPSERSQIGHIKKEVFEAFGLEPPAITPSASSKSDTKTTDIKKTDTPAPQKPLSTEKDSEVEKNKVALESWVQGVTLAQSIANLIRRELAGILNDQIDWNAERCLKIEIDPSTQISIPNAGGQGRIKEDNCIEIASDHKDKDGRLRSEILSLIRLRVIRENKSDYFEYEEDCARIGNLIDRLMPQALRVIRLRNIEQCQMITLALATNSGALGLSLRGLTAKSLHSYLFGNVERPALLQQDAPQSFREWKAFQVDIWNIRKRLTEQLVATSGCFQGTGANAYGVDIVRLTENYPEAKDRLDVAKIDRLTPEERTTLVTMSEQRVLSRLKLVETEYIKIRKEIIKNLGEKFDKNSIAEEFKCLAEEMSRGFWDTVSIGATCPEFIRLTEDFRSAAIVESLSPDSINDAQDDDGAENNSKIFKVSAINLPPVLLADRFVRLANAVLAKAKSHASMLETQFAGVNPVKKSEEILNLLTNIDKQLTKLTENK